MSSESQKWGKLCHSPYLITLVIIWIVVSYMLWRSWQNGAPWPLGMAMPF